MKIRFGYINMFVGASILLTTFVYGVSVNNLMVDFTSYFIGCIIVLVGVLQCKTSDLEDRIKKLEEMK